MTEIALIYTIVLGHDFNAKLLIESGANVNFILKNNDELQEFIIEDTIKKNYYFLFKVPLIYFAIQFVRLTILKLLINNGAQTFFPNYYGPSLLSYASTFNQTEICEYLIRNDFHLDKNIYIDRLIKTAETHKNDRLIELFTKLKNDQKLIKMLPLITKWTECMNNCIYQIKDPIGYKRALANMCHRQF